jgi:periplasmic protein CpxP/Spy
MNAFKTTVSALALVGLAAGGIGAATLAPTALHAQTAQTAPSQVPDGPGHRPRFDAAVRARFLEGRIAFIKAVLRITPAQDGAFSGLADAMRANFKDRAASFEQLRADRDKPKTVVDRLETRVRLTKMRVANQERLLAAVKPLYDSLTPDQKKAADNLIAGVGPRRMHGRRG